MQTIYALAQQSGTGLSDPIAVGALIVAVAGLVQPWALYLYRRYVSRPKIEVYPSGTVTVGYGDHGPSIELTGVIRALQHDAFVESVSVKACRDRDNASYSFTAYVHKSGAIGPSGEQALEVASGFNVPVTAPKRYTIFFRDEQRLREIRQPALHMQNEWIEFSSQKLQAHSTTAPSNKNAGQSAEDLRMELYRQFTATSKAQLEFYGLMNRANYWDAGTYTLEIVVKTAAPAQTFRCTRKISLTAADSKNLQLNTIVTIQKLCGVEYGAYNFASCEYQESLTK